MQIFHSIWHAVLKPDWRRVLVDVDMPAYYYYILVPWIESGRVTYWIAGRLQDFASQQKTSNRTHKRQKVMTLHWKWWHCRLPVTSYINPQADVVTGIFTRRNTYWCMWIWLPMPPTLTDGENLGLFWKKHIKANPHLLPEFPTELWTPVEFLFGIGTAIVKPVSMSMTVKMHLLPLLLGGWIGPTRSMQMNSIGRSGTLKWLKLCSAWPWFWRMHSVHFLQWWNTCLWITGQ